MSYTTLSTQFDNEKLKAMQFAISAKGLDAAAEVRKAMNDTLQKMFDQHVPKNIREYINYLSQSEQEPTLFHQQPQQSARRASRPKEQQAKEPPSASDIIKGQVEMPGVKKQEQTPGQQPDKGKQEQEHAGR